MSKSLIELAYEFVAKQNGPVAFSKIWEYVKATAELDDETAAKKAGQFFTNMMLDGRFVTLGENEWDLREHHTFDKVHIDMRDVYNDVDTDDDDEEEAAERKEEDEAFEEDESLDKDSDESFDSEDEENY